MTAPQSPSDLASCDSDSQLPASLLIGRSRELALLQEHLSAALSGHGRLVLISGEAGIGKTALASALVTKAEAQGALVLIGRCYDLSERPPYGLWRDLVETAPTEAALASAGDLLASGSGSEPLTSQAALFARLRDSIVALAAGQPLVLILDDLHWADPASLELVRLIARSTARCPLLLVGTYRSDELPHDHPLAARLPHLIRETTAVRLNLHRLDDTAVQLLIQARYQLPPEAATRLVAYLRTADGNPFYLGELLRTLEEHGLLEQRHDAWWLGDLSHVAIPSLLRQVIMQRIERLGQPATDLLAIGAVIGQEVPLAVWQAVAGVDEETLLQTVEAAVAAYLLDAPPSGTSVRFVHALVRETLYYGLLAPRRLAWHRRIGDGLAAMPKADPDMVAYHLRQAGDPRAATWLIQAGERAYRTYAWLTAAERFEEALALLDETATAERGWLLVHLALLRRYAAPHQGIACLEEARRIASLTQDPVLAACTRFNLGLLLGFVGRYGLGAREMEPAIADLQALSPVEQARLRERGITSPPAEHGGTLALWYTNAGRFADALALAEPIAAQPPSTLATGMLDVFPYFDAHFALGLTHAALGQPAAARRAYQQTRSVLTAAGHHHMIGGVVTQELMTVTLPYAADHAGELQQLEQEATIAWNRGWGAFQSTESRYVFLPLMILRGEWHEARQMAQAQWSARDANTLLAASLLGTLARLQGDTACAWEVIAEVLPAGPATEPGESHFISTLALLRLAAELALDDGDLTMAQAWLTAHDRWLAWNNAILGQADGHLLWAVYYCAAGNAALARQRARTAQETALTPRQPLVLLGVHRLLGQLDLAVDNPTSAAEHLDTALALADACIARHEQALTLLALAELRLATGRAPEAQALLDEVQALCTPMGARPTLNRVAALRARLASAHRTTASNPAGLSLRELEVLREVAAGLTDAQAAERLSISPRTVSQHLRSIYNKLGISSRAAAVRFAAEHDLLRMAEPDAEMRKTT